VFTQRRRKYSECGSCDGMCARPGWVSLVGCTVKCPDWQLQAVCAVCCMWHRPKGSSSTVLLCLFFFLHPANASTTLLAVQGCHSTPPPPSAPCHPSAPVRQFSGLSLHSLTQKPTTDKTENRLKNVVSSVWYRLHFEPATP
jgi:hypothetical protein